MGDRNLRTYGEGQVLFRQGETGGELYFIQSGKIELSVHTPRTGTCFVIAVVEGPTVLGTMTFLEGDARAATAKALSRVKCLVVDQSQREDLLKTIPDWFRAVIKDLSFNVRRLTIDYTDLKSENESLQERVRRLEALTKRIP